MLGEEQWAAARAYLDRASELRVQTLFVVLSIPVAHVARWAVRLGAWVHETVAADLRDRWCSGPFVADRDRLLDELFDWQIAAPRRQVIILSGDVHAASAFSIERRQGGGVIQEFTSSALTHPLRGAKLLINRVGVYGHDLFEPRFRFRRRLLVYENNFGIVDVTPLPQGGHRVEFAINGWIRKARRLGVAGRVVTTPDAVQVLPGGAPARRIQHAQQDKPQRR